MRFRRDVTLASVGAAIGAGLAALFDPSRGKGRRAEVRDRTAGTVRRSVRVVERRGRGVVAHTAGTYQRVTHLREQAKEQPNDATLADKVRSEIFRDAHVPKGDIAVNAQDGVIQLRGEVQTPDQIRDLETKTRKVSGVRDVENLLHVQGQPAPMHQ
jgi:osmotically-inducible protein OsmY